MTPAKLAEIEGLMEKATPGPVTLRQPWIMEWPEHNCCDEAPRCKLSVKFLLGHTHDAAAVAALVNAAPDLIVAARFGMEARTVIAQIVDAAWDSNPSDQSQVERIARAFLDAHPEDR